MRHNNGDRLTPRRRQLLEGVRDQDVRKIWGAKRALEAVDWAKSKRLIVYGESALGYVLTDAGRARLGDV